MVDQTSHANADCLFSKNRKPYPANFPYNERLQEEVYLAHLGKHFSGCCPLVRNTFLHFDFPLGLACGGDGTHVQHFHRQSAPTIILRQTFRTKYPAMELKHNRKECRPCAFHQHRVDGCRHGELCEFCHLCPADQLRKWKKEKKKRLNSMARAATNLEDPSSDTSTSVETQCGGASGFSTDSA